MGPPEAVQSWLLLIAGPVAAGCSGPRPGQFWELLRTEISNILWVPVPVSPSLMVKKTVHAQSCACFLLSCHHTPKKESGSHLLWTLLFENNSNIVSPDLLHKHIPCLSSVSCTSCAPAPWLPWWPSTGITPVWHCHGTSEVVSQVELKREY